jgi:transcriptional regulator with XRE-family HTH domain
MDEQNTRESRESAIKHMRESAAARVRNTSLRGVAREIGMSPTGLKKFLQGTEPYAPTLRRLRAWYVQYGASPAGEVKKEEASAALEVLVHDLSPDPRAETAGGMLELLGRGYELSGRGRPAWVAELRTEYRARRDPL